MATTKVIIRPYAELTKRSNGSANYERYTSEKATQFTGHGVQKDNIFDSFKTVQKHHNHFREDFFMGEIIQAFSPDLCKPGVEKKFHEIGVEFVNRVYPGHQAVVITHTDKRHYHNHIFVNPVHPEKGTRLDQGAFYALNLRTVNDQLMRENGIPVVERKGPQKAKLHYTAFRMVLDGRKSSHFDLIKKLDVARSVSRDMKEFNSVLSKFGINNRITNKKISFSHPMRKKNVRGDSLGTNYDLETLKETFKHNNKVYQKKPHELKSQIAELDKLGDLKAYKSDSYDFINYVDETGHQAIQERIDFINLSKKEVLERKQLFETRKREKKIRDVVRASSKAGFESNAQDIFSDIEKSHLEEVKNQRLESDLDLRNKPKKRPSKSDDFGIDL